VSTSTTFLLTNCSLTNCKHHALCGFRRGYSRGSSKFLFKLGIQRHVFAGFDGNAGYIGQPTHVEQRKPMLKVRRLSGYSLKFVMTDIEV
jgi:hypothetical protein